METIIKTINVEPAEPVAKALFDSEEKIKNEKAALWMLPENKQRLDEELSDQEDKYFAAC